MKLQGPNQAVIDQIPKLKWDSNLDVWAQKFQAVIKAEDEDLWKVIIGAFKPSMNLVPVSIPSEQQALAGASTYWVTSRPSPAQVNGYLNATVHRINKKKSDESKRIRQLKYLAHFYIQAAVSQEMHWMIAGETDPKTCFDYLSYQYGNPEDPESRLPYKKLSDIKFQGSGAIAARAFVTSWYERLSSLEHTDPAAPSTAKQYLSFLDALTGNKSCDDWINTAKFKFGNSVGASSMAEVFQSFMSYQTMLDGSPSSSMSTM